MKRLIFLFALLSIFIGSQAQKRVNTEKLTVTEKITYKGSVWLQDSLDMNSKRIKDLQAGVDLTDAVNLGQLNDSIPKGVDTLNYNISDSGYFKLYDTDGDLIDSTFIGDANIFMNNDGTVSHLGDLKEHFAHASSPYIATGAAVSDNGDGTINITTSEVYIKASNDLDGDFIGVTVPDSLSMPINAEDNLILYVDYNSGNPVYRQRISTGGYFYSNWDEIPFATVVNITSGIIVNDFMESATNAVYKNVLGQLNYQPIRYLGGLGTAEVGTRQLSVSAGAVLLSNEYTGIATINTSISDTFTRMYITSGTWTRTTGQTTVDNTQYNNTTTGLISISNNKYVNKWLYYVINAPSFWVLVEGQQEYTALADAEEGGIPSTLPPELSQFYAGSLLVAKIIVQQGTTNTIEIQNPFETTFSSSASSDHNNLSNLQLAASGVTYGHIDDQAQTIAGNKTFSDSTVIDATLSIGTAITEGNKVTIATSSDTTGLSVYNTYGSGANGQVAIVGKSSGGGVADIGVDGRAEGSGLINIGLRAYADGASSIDYGLYSAKGNNYFEDTVIFNTADELVSSDPWKIMVLDNDRVKWLPSDSLGGSGGGITGTLTEDFIPVADASGNLEDGLIQDNGTEIEIGGSSFTTALFHVETSTKTKAFSSLNKNTTGSPVSGYFSTSGIGTGTNTGINGSGSGATINVGVLGYAQSSGATTNRGGSFVSSSGTTNIAGQFDAYGGTTNLAIYTIQGKVRIDDITENTSPASGTKVAYFDGSNDLGWIDWDEFGGGGTFTGEVLNTYMPYADGDDNFAESPMRSNGSEIAMGSAASASRYMYLYNTGAARVKGLEVNQTAGGTDPISIYGLASVGSVTTATGVLGHAVVSSGNAFGLVGRASGGSRNVGLWVNTGTSQFDVVADYGTPSAGSRILTLDETTDELEYIDFSDFGGGGTFTGAVSDGYIPYADGADNFDDSPFRTDGSTVGIGAAPLSTVGLYIRETSHEKGLHIYSTKVSTSSIAGSFYLAASGSTTNTAVYGYAWGATGENNFAFDADQGLIRYQNCPNEGTATSKILTIDANLHINYRTPAEILSDIGASSNPMTTQGDIIKGGSSGVAERLAAGTIGQMLYHDGTDPYWGAAPTGTGDVTSSGMTSGYVPYATASKNIENSALRADATNAAIGQAPSSDTKLRVTQSAQDYGIYASNAHSAGAFAWGVYSTVTGTGVGTKIAVTGIASGAVTGVANVGIYGEASGAFDTNEINIGGDFYSNGSSGEDTNMAVRCDASGGSVNNWALFATSGDIHAFTGDYYQGGDQGVTTTWTNAEGDVVTVSGGIITDISAPPTPKPTLSESTYDYTGGIYDVQYQIEYSPDYKRYRKATNYFNDGILVNKEVHEWKRNSLLTRMFSRR